MRFTFSNLPATGWKLSAKRIVDLARLAEDAKFDRFAIADLPFHYDCVTVMSACLLGTRRIAVESLVTNPYTRDPALVAAAWATLADLSDGRAILGIGGGVESATKVWVGPYGHERPHPAQAVREAVSVYRALWRGERVNIDGVIHVHDARLDCPPPPPIPILVAARGEHMLDLAGELADIVHLASLFLDPKHQRENIDRVVAAADRAGRARGSYEIDVSVTLSVSVDRDAARRAARRNAAQTILWMSGTDRHNRRRKWTPPAQLDVPERVVRELTDKWDMWNVPELPAELEPLIDDELLDRFTIAGTPTECAARLGRLAAQLPEMTGVRVKLPRPVGSASYDDFAADVRGMGAVIREVGSTAVAR